MKKNTKIVIIGAVALEVMENGAKVQVYKFLKPFDLK